MDKGSIRFFHLNERIIQSRVDLKMYVTYDENNLEDTKCIQEHQGITWLFFIAFNFLITSMSF